MNGLILFAGRRPVDAACRRLARLVCTAVFLLGSTVATAQTADEVLAAAFKPQEGPKKAHAGAAIVSAGYFQDAVDPYSGNLNATVSGISIPGNGGLTISAGLAYSMDGLKNSGSSRLTASSSAMFTDTRWSAGAWSLSLAPKISFYEGGNNINGSNLCAPPPATPGYSGALSYGFIRIFVEFADGRGERLFYTGPGVFETKGRWKLSCSGSTHILRSPDGISYTLGNRTRVLTAGNGFSNTYQTTRATDRDGNYFDIFVQAQIYTLSREWSREAVSVAPEHPVFVFAS